MDPDLTQKSLSFNSARFLISASKLDECPPDHGAEVAFAGRSNAGKSSALNAITANGKLARTSKTPGRTQLINTFSLDPTRRLIDLPGYGFAKVPLAVKQKWQKSLAEYLMKRDSLKGLVVLMDIRHPLKDLDQDLIHWAVESELPVLILLTKADKLGPGARKKTLLEVREAALAFMGDVTVHSFSSLNKQGLSDLEQVLDLWFGADEAAQIIVE